MIFGSVFSQVVHLHRRDRLLDERKNNNRQSEKIQIHSAVGVMTRF